MEKRFPIRIKDCDSVCYSFNVSNSMTIKELIREYIKKKKESNSGNFNENMDLTLFFKGRDLNNNETIERYKIKPNNTLSIFDLNQPIRAAGGYFVDVTNEKTIQKEVTFWKENDPKWRIIERGINFYGICINKKCEAFNKEVIRPKGYGEIDMVKENFVFECPICETFFKAKTVGFYSCQYWYEYKKYDDKKEKIIQDKSEIKTTINNKLTYYPSNLNREALFLELKFFAK